MKGEGKRRKKDPTHPSSLILHHFFKRCRKGGRRGRSNKLCFLIHQNQKLGLVQNLLKMLCFYRWKMFLLMEELTVQLKGHIKMFVMVFLTLKKVMLLSQRLRLVLRMEKVHILMNWKPNVDLGQQNLLLSAQVVKLMEDSFGLFYPPIGS